MLQGSIQSHALLSYIVAPGSMGSLSTCLSTNAMLARTSASCLESASIEERYTADEHSDQGSCSFTSRSRQMHKADLCSEAANLFDLMQYCNFCFTGMYLFNKVYMAVIEHWFSTS